MGTGQANGLCFSVSESMSHPPSLKNIFKEIQQDLKIPYPKSGNLESWAKQGVLLLNASLTVRKDEANSHRAIMAGKYLPMKPLNNYPSQKEGVNIFALGRFCKKEN